MLPTLNPDVVEEPPRVAMLPDCDITTGHLPTGSDRLTVSIRPVIWSVVPGDMIDPDVVMPPFNVASPVAEMVEVVIVGFPLMAVV